MTTTNTNSSARTLTIPNLVNGQIYRARVSAVNNYGQGPFANWIQVTPSEFSTDEYYYDNTLLMHFDDNRTGTYDAYGDSVTLLMRMNGSGSTFQDDSLYGNIITSFGSATQSTDQSKFGNSSAYFNGSSYVSAGTSSLWNISSGDFTIEGWVYNTGANQYRGIIGSRGNGNGHGWCLFIHSDNTFYTGSVIVGQSYANRQLNTTIVEPNTWTHFALVKTSAGYRLYVNGVGGSLLELSNGFDYQSSQPLVIGALGSQGEYPFLGYIDEIRITKGIARYTSNFSIPTEAFPAISPLFVDSSAYNNPLIVSSTSISSSSSKFGGYSGYFNGSSFVRSPGTDVWQLGTDDFTVEAWINPSLMTNSRTIASTYDGSNGGWRLMVGSPAGGTPSYGPEVIFTATNYGDEVDVIIPGVLEITRNNNQGIYNSAVEGGHSRYSSPVNTSWNGGGWSNVCNYATRSYYDWLTALNYAGRSPGDSPGLEMVMKHVPTNRYWLIKFTNWQSNAGGGAFAYTRKEILGCVTDSSVVEFRNGDSPVITKNTATPITTGEWHHVAAVRSSGVLKLFLDGTQVGSDSSFTANITRNNTYGLSVGAYTLSNGSSSDYFNGYLDDLRITKGVARYPTNFSVPVAPAPNLGPASTVPSSPSNLVVSEDQGIVSLSWNRPSAPKIIDSRSPITYYGVEYSNNGGSSWTEHSVVSGGSLLTRNISGLPANTPYLFRVRAQNSVGFGPYSSTANISTLSNAPSGVSAIGDDNQAFVSWTAPTPNNSSIRDYGIQYSSDSGASWNTYPHSPSIDTLINVTGLNNTLNYSFKVAAVNLAGTGIYSADSSPITVAPRSDNLYNKTRILLHLDSN